MIAENKNICVLLGRIDRYLPISAVCISFFLAISFQTLTVGTMFKEKS